MDFIRSVDQTVFSSPMGVILVLAFVLLAGALVSASRLPTTIKVLVWLGLGFRVGGALVRFLVLQNYYGAGDATGYFGRGWRFATAFREFDFTPVTEMGQLQGTGFIHTVSGAVLTIIGPSMFGEFVVFSLFSFVGLVGFAVAFHRAYPTAALGPYLAWIWLFPSLWFWPSSIGKEALILMGLGIAVMGFIGKGKKIAWLPFLIGGAVMFLVRPEIVPIFLVSVVIAQWLSFRGGWTPQRLLQGILLLVIGLVGISYTSRSIGLEQLDLEGLQEFVTTDKSRKTEGSTSVELVDPSLTGVPMAVINVLFRPVPWEATNPMVLISSMEVMFLWALVLARRKSLSRSLPHWRSDRFLRLALCFLAIYSVALGMMVINLGILARQRIFLYPFLFLLIEARPVAASLVPVPRRPVRPATRREHRPEVVHD